VVRGQRMILARGSKLGVVRIDGLLTDSVKQRLR
jgi:hypothetical protein